MNQLGKLKTLSLLLFCLAATALSSAQTYNTIYSFSGTDAANPVNGLTQATDGNIYTASVYGGAMNDGAVVAISTAGVLVHDLSLAPSTGINAYAGVVQGTDGNIYGTTNFGGSNGLGVVYKISAGTLTVLHNFAASDGSPAQGGIIQGADGNFYGTTLFNGANGAGTVFKITPSGVFTVLHAFTRSGGEGGNPYETLVQANDGNFYGTTWDGGSEDHGTVFEVTPGGLFRTLYRFCTTDRNVCPDGYNPQGSLIQGADGYLYGTTVRGGGTPCGFNGYAGCGTAFKISTSGTFTQLHLFEGTDGAGPTGALVQGTDGNFYGIAAYDTVSSCTNGCRSVYQMTPAGTVTTLHEFCQLPGCTDGVTVAGGLIQNTSGVFYGPTIYGGTSNDGVIYSLDLGFGPFVKTNPVISGVGHPVRILGTNLTGATSVTFNGTPATFTVVSATEINTAVPTGATSGSVQVVTPSGTLTSNINFTVR